MARVRYPYPGFHSKLLAEVASLTYINPRTQRNLQAEKLEDSAIGGAAIFESHHQFFG